MAGFEDMKFATAMVQVAALPADLSEMGKMAQSLGRTLAELHRVSSESLSSSLVLGAPL